ncbi:MAG: hypothetical protein QM579_07825 [Desulfovibrio sp.]|uniref:hypothetical protein n=1 Tax=Desulfovibrio sp. TaxID=885 RepID=UPI0039E48F27
MAVDSTQETGSVEDAKRRLREASAGFDPYALVRSRPLSCTGGAFLLGLGWKWLRPGRAVSGLTALSLQALGKVFAQNMAVRLKDGLTGERLAEEHSDGERPADTASAVGDGQVGTAGNGASVQNS